MPLFAYICTAGRMPAFIATVVALAINARYVAAKLSYAVIDAFVAAFDIQRIIDGCFAFRSQSRDY